VAKSESVGEEREIPREDENTAENPQKVSELLNTEGITELSTTRRDRDSEGRGLKIHGAREFGTRKCTKTAQSRGKITKYSNETTRLRREVGEEIQRQRVSLWIMSAPRLSLGSENNGFYYGSES
jgi:hypothetical protein